MIEKTSPKWTVKFSPLASRELKALDKSIHKPILGYIYQKLETEENPRRFGKALSGNLKDFWRYRIKDYRVICEIKGHGMEIMAVRVAHRRDVYKNVHFLKPSL